MAKHQLESGNQESESLMKRMGYLWREYLRYEKWTLLGAGLLGALSAIAGGFGLPFLLNSIFPIIFGRAEMPEACENLLISWFGADNIHVISIWVAASFFPLIVLIRGVAGFGNVYYLTKAGLGVLEKMRLSMYRCFQNLSLSFHDKRQKGDLLSRLMGDTASLQDGLIQVTNDLIIQPLTLLSALAYLIYRSFVSEQFMILLLNMLLVGACVIPIQKIGRKLLSRARVQQAQMGDLSSTIQENLASQRDIRAFELESQQIGMFRTKIRSFLEITLSVVRWKSILTPMIEVVSALAIAVTLYIGARNHMTLGDFSALVAAMYLCYEPVKKLGAVQNRMKTMMASFERVDEILSTEDEVPEPKEPKTMEKWNGRVEYRNVSFAYDPEHPVIHNVSLDVPAGQVVALVGPSGSGKTTMINLLCRFYDVQSGNIFVDGVDVRDFGKQDLMSHIALVSQFPIIFRGTILENILIGKPSADREMAINASKKAAVDSFVFEEKEGYDRLIGEMGEGLSGGQRQRVSIARAFLKDAPILILDEATASLDMKSEELIQKEIETLSQGRTTFVIAHRFSTIRMADRILVMEKGRIIGDGTHEELMDNCPMYRDLYERQIMPANNEEAV